MIGSIVAALAIGYVCGSVPSGLWLGRAFRGVDVRTLGSGNLGATNVFRSLGRGLGVATLLLDMLKGALPVVLVTRSGFGAAFPGGAIAGGIAVGIAAILGHMFTFLAGFRGGKGVATTEVGMPRLTSSAWLGPVITTGPGSDSVSVKISLRRRRDPCSRPLLAETGIALVPTSRTRSATSRNA